MAGLGNKSIISDVTTVDFSEGAVGVYVSLKNPRKSPRIFFFRLQMAGMPTLRTSELPGWTLGGARTVVCREIK